MRKYRLLLIIFIVILAACEKKEINTDEINWEVTQISNLQSNDIIVDKDNTKWIGTNTGLYNNTGNELNPVSITLPGKVLSLMYEETNNLLWIGTDAGLVKATINGKQLTDITNIATNNLSNDTILSGYADLNQRRWFGTRFGISMNEEEKWKNDSFRINATKRIFSMKPVEFLAVNSIASWEGDYFFATSGGSLYRAAELNDTVDAFTGATQWVSPYNGDNLTSNMYVVFIDSKGSQWMGGEHGVQVHSGHDAVDATSFTYYRSELADSVVHEIAEDPSGNFWIGTEKGLSILKEAKWSTITDELPDIYITAIAFDKQDGSAWVGTKNGIVLIK